MNRFAAAIGWINIDIIYAGIPRMPELGEEVLAKEFDLQLGGGPPATLITLSRLGIDARLGTFLSDDFMSDFAKRILERNGVTYKNFYRGSDIPIAVTSVVTFPQDRCFISYFPDKRKLVCTDEEVYDMFTGAGVCIAVEGHSEVLKKLRREGTIIVYDIGWSDDLDIENLKNILKYVDVFTPNSKEAMKMTGKSTPEEALEVISRYVEHAIVKLGKDGCITKMGNKIIHVPALDIFSPVDTTGAGDAFLAGVMYGLLQGWDIEKCMKMGNITGGYCTTELGCCKAYLTIEKAMQYMNYY